MSIREILFRTFEIHALYKDKAQKEAKIISLLNEVGLSPEAIDRYPHEFSGGQKTKNRHCSSFIVKTLK